jgi:hypothetical protein
MSDFLTSHPDVDYLVIYNILLYMVNFSIGKVFACMLSKGPSHREFVRENKIQICCNTGQSGNAAIRELSGGFV